MSTSSITSSSTASIDRSSAARSQVSQKMYKEKIAFDKCPQCFVQFDFLKRNTGLYSKVPLILSCKHIVCEDCLRKTFSASFIICPVCKENFPFARNQLDKLTEYFTPHYALMGYMMWNKPGYNHRPSNLQLMPTGLTLKSRQMSDVNMQKEVTSDVNDLTDSRDLLSSLQFQKCVEHNGFRNILCENCSETVCCYCFLENHPGHTPLYLYKLNTAEMNELQELKAQCDVILKQLYMSQAKVKELKVFDLPYVESKIRSYFTHLYGKLHVIEKTLVEKLSSLDVKDGNLEDIEMIIRYNIKRVTQAVNAFNLVHCKEVNVKALFDEIKHLKNLPCRISSSETVLDPIQFVVNHDFDELEDDFSLDNSSSIEYNLQPIEDWTNISFNAVEKSSQPETQKKQRKHRKKPSSSTCSSRSKSDDALTPSSFQMKEELIKVGVTHINSIDSFYVQKYKDENLLKNINMTIEKKLKVDLIPEDVQLGVLYGALYVVKNVKKWRRAKVTQIIVKNPADIRYNVLFIDYGNTQEVTIDRLKRLDLYTSKQPPCAIECKLSNPDKHDFSTVSVLDIAQLLNEKEIYMKVVQTVNKNLFEVDLLVLTSCGNKTSVRDLLLQSEAAKITARDNKGSSDIKDVRFFKNSKTFCIGQKEDVVVTFVRDPDYICVQLDQNTDMIKKMVADMKSLYQNKRMYCVPLVDSDVIAKCEDTIQGEWHRARVVSVNVHTKQAEVFFPDWGGSGVIPWSNIRILIENFTKIECQGIIVKMAHVKPTDSVWSTSAIDFLNRQIAIENKFKMVVSKVDPLEVAFFQNQADVDICLNALLVENQLALSTGNLSEVVCWPNTPITENIEQDDDDLSSTLIKKAEAMLLDEDNPNFKEGLHYEVSVVKFDSPDLIYVKFSAKKAVEEELHKNLQIHYSETRKNKKNWKPSECCIVYDLQKKKYFRAVIKSLGDKFYTVYLFDHARELKVQNENIFIQTEYFKGIPNLTYKCRLAGIRPAGDSGSWSILANEILSKIFKTYKTIHIKKVEGKGTDTKIMGVHMWYLLTIPGNALEPSTYKFISINKALLECGVAFSANNNFQKSAVVESEYVASPFEEDGIDGSSASTLCDNNAKTIELNEVADTNSNTSASGKDNWYESIMEDERILKLPIVEWPPIMPLQKMDFDATLTCVDSEGVFSIRDEDLQAIYLNLEKSLKETFQSINVSLGNNVKWQAGEVCTIRYNNSWYRGTVIEIEGPTKIAVEMIDFGSAHVMHPKDLYKQIMHPDMPPLINRIKLYDVQPKNGIWNESYVNELLDIVTEDVRVVIKSSLEEPIPSAEIYVNEISVNNEIVKRAPGLIRTRVENQIIPSSDSEKESDDEEVCEVENNFIIEEGGQEYDSFDELSNAEQQEVVENVANNGGDCDKNREGFTYYPLPDHVEGKVRMQVSSVVGCQKIVLNTINKNVIESNDFNDLHEDIQNSVEDLPLLEHFEEDKPCVCLKSDKCWARGVIFSTVNIEFGFVLIFFVDYGTLEMVSLQNVKAMKTEWFVLPVCHRVATLNVDIINTNKVVSSHINQLVGKYVDVEILCENPLIVHVYEKNKLYYQNLITQGLLKM